MRYLSSSIQIKDNSYIPLCISSDNSDENIECTVSGRPNPCAVGEHTLTYGAVDSHGNEAMEIDVTLTIVKGMKIHLLTFPDEVNGTTKVLNNICLKYLEN